MNAHQSKKETVRITLPASPSPRTANTGATMFKHFVLNPLERRLDAKRPTDRKVPVARIVR